MRLTSTEQQALHDASLSPQKAFQRETCMYPDDPLRQALALSAAQMAARQLVEWLRPIEERTKA